MITRPSRRIAGRACSSARVLLAAAVGMRHPDRRHAEHLGEAVVGQRAAEVGQHHRRPRRRCARSSGGRRSTQLCSGSVRVARNERDVGRAHLDLRQAGRAQRLRGSPAETPPGRCRPCSGSGNGPTARGGTALTGSSGLPAVQASTSKLFQANTFSAGDRPGSPQPGSIAGSPAAAASGRPASARRTAGGIARGLSVGEPDRAARRDDGRDRVGQEDRRIGQEAAPVAGVMAGVAQLDHQVES